MKVFKLLKNIVLFTMIMLHCKNLHAQDVWLQSHSLPISGCSKTASEVVQVSILNNSATTMVFNSITASYSVDGGAPISQLIGATLGANASINFSFNVNANLSACGPRTVKVWVHRAGDLNQLNDTLTWVVQNDCPIVPGTILSSANVCNGSNSGSLTLSGWSNGIITSWQTSTNGGTTWNTIPNSTITNNYLNVNQVTQYRVFIDGGYCPDAYSPVATLTPVPQPVQGTISGNDSVCIANANGTITVSGTTNSILQWESSTNNGATWNTIANTNYIYNYSGLLTTTLFRALINGNGCPNIYSNTCQIYVDPNSAAGTISGSDSLCASNASGTLILYGSTGPVDYWEYSTDLISWTNITSNSSIITFNSLTQTTYYRAHTIGAFCPSQFSDTAEIFIQPATVAPSLTGGGTFCISSVSGTLTLSSVPSPIIRWEYSDNGGTTWVNIANTGTTEAFSGLTVTRIYRVLLEGGLCTDYYSDPATVTVTSITVPGTITGSVTLCNSNATGALIITGAVGTVSYWESSTDGGLTWTNIAATTATYNYTSLSQTTWFRAYTDGGSCPSFFTDTAIVTIEDIVNGGTITGSGVFCDQATLGQLDLIGNNNTIVDWEYSVDNGTTWLGLGNPASSFPYASITTTTMYRVLVSGNICPNAYSDTATIKIDALSFAGTLKSDTTLCAGKPHVLKLQGAIGTTAWQTSTNGITWTPNALATDSSYSITNAQSTEYFQVIVTNGVCPPVTSNTITVTVLPTPFVTVSADTTINSGDTITIVGIGGAVGMWLPDYMISDNSVSIATVYPPTTTYYAYYVMGLNGCVGSDSLLITVIPPTALDIKNVITANGDSYNDFWMIAGIENYPETEVHVFNIYGNEVFSDQNYMNTWDATYKGRKLPNGTYFYVVRLRETEKEFKGSLTVLGDE